MVDGVYSPLTETSEAGVTFTDTLVGSAVKRSFYGNTFSDVFAFLWDLCPLDKTVKTNNAKIQTL